MDKSKWGYKKLGEVATFLNGYAFKPSEWNSEGLPIIRIQNLTNTNAEYNYFNGDNIDKRYIVNNGDLLVSWSATLGAFIWDGDKAILNQHIFKTIFDKTDIDKHFLRYSIISSLNLMSTKAHGITMRHITKKDFDNIKIRVPPLSDQHHIVSELDKLSDIISLKQQQMKEYDALAQSLFYEMFGDENNQYNGFQTFKLSELFEVGTGSTPSRKLENIYYGGTLNWVKTTEIQGNYISETEEKITQKALDDTNCKMYPSNTILIAMYGQGKTRGQVARLSVPAATNQACAAILPKPEICNTDFLFEFFLLSYERIRNMARGGTQSNLNLSLVKSIEIPLPPLSLQRSFAEKVKAIEHQKSLLKQSIAETQTLLDSRMQEYFG